MGKDGSIAAAGSWPIEFRLAGTFCVIRGGTELPEREVGSRKSRTLLKLLAVERPTLVSVDRIVDVLWAGERPAAAEHNVATLVSRLRGVLGSGIIVGGRQGYRLAGEPRVGVDLDAAARCCERAERTRMYVRMPRTPPRPSVTKIHAMCGSFHALRTSVGRK